MCNCELRPTDRKHTRANLQVKSLYLLIFITLAMCCVLDTASKSDLRLIQAQWPQQISLLNLVRPRKKKSYIIISHAHNYKPMHLVLNVERLKRLSVFYQACRTAAAANIIKQTNTHMHTHAHLSHFIIAE